MALRFAKKGIRCLSVFLPPAVVSIALFTLSYYFFGFFVETNDDLAFVWGLKGYFSLQPITDFLYYHHGLSYFYAMLYAWTHQIAWYGWSMYVYLFIAALLAYFILKNEKATLWENLLIFTAFFTAIFYQHLVHFNFTRSAFLLIIGAFLWALKQIIAKVHRYPIATEQKILSKIIAFGWLFFFAIGFLTRPTTAYLSLALLLPVSVYLALQNRCLKQVGRTVYLPILVLILGFHLLQWLTISPEKQAIIDKQSSIAHLVNAKIVKEGQAWTPKDSIIYEATLHWLVGDKETLTKSALAKYTFEEDLVLNTTTLQRIPNMSEELLKRIWRTYKAVLFWIGVLWALSFWRALSSPTSSSRRKAFLIPLVLILFQLFFVSVLVGVNITMKMPNRVLEPLLLLNMLVMWMLVPHAYWSKKVKLGMVFGILLLSGFSAQKTFTNTRPFLKAQIERQEMVAELNKQLKEKIVLFTLPSAILMEDAHPLKPLNLSANNQYLFLQGWLTALPNFYESLATLPRTSSQTSTKTTFKNAFLDLAKQEEVRLIGNAQTVELLSNYFEVVYGEQLNFRESVKQLKGFEEQGLMVYEFSSPDRLSVK